MYPGKNKPGPNSSASWTKKNVKKKVKKFRTESLSLSKTSTAPKKPFERYSGLTDVKSRREEDRKLPTGSRASAVSDIVKYSNRSNQSIKLCDDVHWNDARRAAKMLFLRVPSLGADLNSDQRTGMENIVTDLLFNVPKWAHELLASSRHSKPPLDLDERTWYNTQYGGSIAVSPGSATHGDLLRSLQFAKVDFNAWSYEHKDTIADDERTFAHYLTTGRLQAKMEGTSKFKYIQSDFFKTFEFSELVTDDDEEEESEEELSDDAASANSDAGTASAIAPATTSSAVRP